MKEIDHIDEIVAFLKISQTSSNEIQKEVYKVYHIILSISFSNSKCISKISISLKI